MPQSNFLAIFPSLSVLMNTKEDFYFHLMFFNQAISLRGFAQ